MQFSANVQVKYQEIIALIVGIESNIVKVNSEMGVDAMSGRRLLSVNDAQNVYVTIDLLNNQSQNIVTTLSACNSLLMLIFPVIL